MKTYKVYEVSPRLSCYSGISLVAANNVNEANSYIADFKRSDVGNVCNSNGYNYVDKDDVIEDLVAERPGLIYYGIFYSG